LTARDWLPAHLVPPGELHGDFGRLTFGTPPSPETRLPRTDEAMAREADAGSGRREPNTAEAKAKPGWEASGPRQPPPIVTIRPCGPHASELYVRTGDGGQVVTVPLSWGHLLNLLEDAAAGLRRCEETR